MRRGALAPADDSRRPILRDARCLRGWSRNRVRSPARSMQHVHDDRRDVWTYARAVAIVSRTRDAGDVDDSCVDRGDRCRPGRTPGRVRGEARQPSEHRYLGRRFIRCRTRIVASAAWIADRSSSSPQVSRSSTHSVASARHPSGVPRAAQPARFSATGPGGPRAREGARTTGTGSHRGDMVGAEDIPNAVHGRCSRRPVPTVVGPHRCRSSRPGRARSIAATASRRVADVA